MKENVIDNGVVYSFFFLGVGVLIPWNAIISDLDFFEDYVKDYHPSFVYPNMNNLLSVVAQYIFIYGSFKFSYNAQLISNFIFSILSLIALPIVIKLIGNILGFILSCVIVLLLGFTNSMCLSSLYSIVNFVPQKCLVMMSIGHAFAGIFINAIRYSTLFFYFNKDISPEEMLNNKFYESLIYYSLSSFMCIVCLFCCIYLQNNQYFCNQMKNIEISCESDEIIPNGKCKLDEKSYNLIKHAKDSEESVFPYLYELSTLLLITNIITFILFPGASLTNKLFDFSDGVRINTLITIFNIFDCFGRYLAIHFTPNKKQLSIYIFMRLLFLFSFPVLTYLEREINLSGSNFSAVILIQMSLFSCSNGFTVTVALLLTPKEVPKNLIGIAGSCMSFYMIFGIVIGSFYALFITQNYLV